MGWFFVIFAYIVIKAIIDQNEADARYNAYINSDEYKMKAWRQEVDSW